MDSPRVSQFQIPVSVISPVVTKARFALLSGLAEGVVQGMIEKGHLPTVKIGRHRLVNVVGLAMECIPERDNTAEGPGVNR